MSLGQLGWAIVLAGLPWAHFLWLQLDLVHAATWWAQTGLTLLFVWGLTQRRVAIDNWPLACWASWMVVLMSLAWNTTWVQTHGYPFPLLMGFGHLLTILMAYSAAVSWWTAQTLPTLLRWMARSYTVVLGYCVLQVFGLDQFFINIDLPTQHNILGGTVGNSSHLAAWLACGLPLVLMQSGKGWKAVQLLNMVLLAVLIVQKQAAGGLLAAGAGLAVWCWYRARIWTFLLAGVALAAVAWVFSFRAYLNPHGRLEMWAYLWELIQRRPITGYGPGFLMTLSQQITDGPLKDWRHAHNEYLQLWLEQGLIGLGLVLWGLWETVQVFRRLPKTPLVVGLGAMGTAFLTNATVNFPAHLWQVGIYGLVAYAGLWVLSVSEPAEVRMGWP